MSHLVPALGHPAPQPWGIPVMWDQEAPGCSGNRVEGGSLEGMPELGGGGLLVNTASLGVFKASVGDTGDDKGKNQDPSMHDPAPG